MLGSTAADAVIPTFPAKIIIAAKTTIIFFILCISLTYFPFLAAVSFWYFTIYIPNGITPLYLSL